jgi:diadenosine tetraphosphate (Ap4A) HIT family hydrolase
MTDEVKQWMPREWWDALVRGEGCPLCREVQSSEGANLGNAVPQLHTHIKPRYYGDDAPGMPIWADKHEVMLADETFGERVRVIREALQIVLTD